MGRMGIWASDEGKGILQRDRAPPEKLPATQLAAPQPIAKKSLSQKGQRPAGNSLRISHITNKRRTAEVRR